MRPLQDVVNLRLTALCIADRLSCLYRSRDLVHHSFFPGSQIKGSNANRNNIKTDNISHTSGTGSPALVPSLASYCFMVTSGIKSGGETKCRPRQNFSAGKRLYALRAPHRRRKVRSAPFCLQQNCARSLAPPLPNRPAAPGPLRVPFTGSRGGGRADLSAVPRPAPFPEFPKSLSHRRPPLRRSGCGRRPGGPG